MESGEGSPEVRELCGRFPAGGDSSPRAFEGGRGLDLGSNLEIKS